MIQSRGIGVYVALLAAAWGLGLADTVRAAEAWLRQEVNLAGPGGTRIVAIHTPAPSKTAAPKALDAPAAASAPVPIGGFIPYVAVATTNSAYTGEFLFAHVLANSWTGTPLIPPLETSYAIAVMDTGATQHVIGEADRARLGLNGLCLNGPCLTGNTVPLGGAGGTTIDADVTERMGVFVAGLGAVNPATLVLDTAKLTGHWNVSLAAFPPGTCVLGPVLPTLIGTPLLAFKDVHIRNDAPVSRTRDGNLYEGPTVEVYPRGSPLMPTYRRSFPLDARPAGVSVAAYYPNIQEFDFETPWIPTSLAAMEGTIPSGGWFFASVRVANGSSGELSRLFMFDTGAQVSVIRTFLAGQLGLNLNRPEFTVEVLDATCNVTMAKGFYLDTFKIDAFGNPIVRNDVPVIVQDITSIEGGTLEGIIGTNLFVGTNLAIKPSLSGASFVEVSQRFGDFDEDGDVDGTDFGFFGSCFNGSGNLTVSLACDPADADGDGDVDGSDYGMFAACFNGSGNPPGAGCPLI